jgi:SAM-dependent methyltransferase
MTRSSVRFAALIAALAALISAVVLVAADEQPKRVSLAPYYPTPAKIVAEMLKLGELKPGELHYDLGSGDGRLVIAAARDFKARSVGFEIDSSLVTLSRNKIAELKLTPLARIEQQDLLEADFSKPDLITTYLLPSSNDKIQPLLEARMKKGARVVSHDFSFKGWKHEKLILVDDDTDFEVREHYLYLYRR